ncbi:STAS domain-containing protein [Leptospira ellisii]|uniref:STAS domain-containing protein n=1 Tax=Leptospira ellisii TaxID=2023197 RepID=A0A2N0BPN2_9LEPT|nr:STAS domain-containing protein [Leptospira ellisii]MDV6236348.1 STAS domain-containing protein [Leptospira ellisii]PJZ93290.1 hypothetical protein CH379_08590 [Leptospira ellisii]PKA05905.1 hypothetical protein CH375_02470 [Leptospira ellisii]
MEPVRRFEHFEIRRSRQSTEIVPLNASFDESSFDELKSVLALVFYQSSVHVKLDLGGVKLLPLPVAMKILGFAFDLRLKNRTLVLVGASPAFKKLIRFYRMDKALLIF